jgi:hypothetical protein
MAEIFTILDNIPQITPEGMYVPEMLEVWDDDTTNDKREARQIWAYIYHTTDPNSIYANYKDNDAREALVLKDYVTDRKLVRTEKVKKAREKYKELKWTATVDFLESIKSMIMKLSTYMKNADIEDGREGNLTQILAVIEKGSKLINSFADLSRAVEREQVVANSKRRADVQISQFDEDEYNSHG